MLQTKEMSDWTRLSFYNKKVLVRCSPRTDRKKEIEKKKGKKSKRWGASCLGEGGQDGTENYIKPH